MNIEKISLDTVNSTNTYAKKHKHSFKKKSLTVITAEEQTAGYGQFQRPWVSPKGENLYCTFSFEMPLSFREKVSTLTLEMAKILQSVLQANGFSPTLKWPNDVLINEKKVAGVLSEIEFGKTIEVILGFGLNVNMEKDLKKIDQKATSLKAETGDFWDKEKLLNEIIETIQVRLCALSSSFA